MSTIHVPTTKSVRIWDLPTRLFHWALVASVVGAYITVKTGNMDWHLRFGKWVFCLLLFRVLWGFVGPHYARFFQFIKGPGAIINYLKSGKKVYGHNPLGALSVIALIGLFGFQVVTGLYTGDGYFYQGPLYSMGRGIRKAMTDWHHQTEIYMILLVALHVTTVFFYAFFKKDNLIRPMITGKTELQDNSTAVIHVEQSITMWRRFIIVAAIALLVTYYVFNGLSF